MSLSQHAADEVRPPEKSGNHTVRQLSTSNVAAESALFASTLKGKYYVTFVALTTDAYIFLKLGSSAASVTTTTGWPLFAGVPQGFWIESGRLTHVEAITTAAAGTLKWYVSSRLFEVPNFVAGT